MAHDYDDHDGLGPTMDTRVVEHDGHSYTVEIFGPSDWDVAGDPGGVPPEDEAAWYAGNWKSVFIQVTSRANPAKFDSVGAQLGYVPSQGRKWTIADIIDDRLSDLVHSAGLAPPGEVITVEEMARAQALNHLFDLDMERYGHVAVWNLSLFGLTYGRA